MPILEQDRGIADYLEQFCDTLRRRDQRDWAGVYLSGLLRELPRKNVKSIAMTDESSSLEHIDDATQALQNFIHQSPWDDSSLLRTYRSRLIHTAATDPQAAIVVTELIFPKQGQHSVGVHRQLSWTRRCKLNCQVGVAVLLTTSQGIHPLAAQLYLPNAWISTPPRMQRAGVPVRYQSTRSRWQIALHLLDELRNEGFPIRSIFGLQGMPSSLIIRQAMRERSWSYLLDCEVDSLHELEKGVSLPVEEGIHAVRDPIGSGDDWLARGDRLRLLVDRLPDGRMGYSLGERASNDDRDWISQRRRIQRETISLIETLENSLGLTDFEGRSWRGFHHHLAMVFLAYDYRSRLPILA